MIGLLSGVVAAVGDDTALIDVGGVGYVVQPGGRTLARLQVGAPARLFIETHVREDAIKLFGFSSEEERAWFAHLQTIPGVGAKVALGILDAMPPTVLVDVDHSMACMTQETFGPTLPVMKVADEAEAIRLANDSVYGLSATVWSRDKERAQRVARQLDTGAVNINDFAANGFASEVPMGGWKQSGIGARGGGAHGIRKYCRPQVITSPLIPTLSSEPMWYPASRRRTAIALGMLRAAASHGLRRIGISPKRGDR